jgi:hypothetical protein
MTPLIGLAIVRNSQKKEKEKNHVAQENPVAGFPAHNLLNKKRFCWGANLW